MAEFWIDIEASDGSKYGPGPITTATSWRQVARLNRAGIFAFEMPASDPRAALVQAKRIARCSTLVNGVVTEIGAGIIDNISLRLSPSGVTMLQVSGDDILRELTDRSVGFLELSDGAGGGTSTALADVLAFAPSGWTFDTTDGYGTTGDTVYGRFAGESVLAALRKVGEQRGENFRLGIGRTVVWLRSDTPASGIRAIGDVDGEAVAGNAAVCLIQSLDEVQDSYDLITRIYAFGAGNGQARITLADATVSADTGYTLGSDSKGSYLARDASEATYKQIERFLSWKEIAPVTNSADDLASAGNALYLTAYQQLSRSSDSQKSYRLTVTKLNTVLYPGQTIRTIWREVVDGYTSVNIDTDLIILETTTEISATGLRTVAMQVATVDKWPESDADFIAGKMDEARLMDAHPQIFGGYYPYNFQTMNLDSNDAGSDSDSQVLPFDNRQTRLVSAKMRIRTAVFESTSKGAASGGGSTSGSGGGTTATSSSGGGTTATSSSGGGTSTSSGSNAGDHGHNISIFNTTTTGGYYPMYTGPSGGIFYYNSGGGSTKTGATGTFKPDHTHSISISSHTHDVTVPNHSHNVTVPDHTHSTPDHTHDPVYGVYRDTQYPGQLTVTINGTDVTNALFGSATIGTDSAALDEEVEIADLLNAASGGFRRDHAIVIEAGSGRGRVFVDFLCFVQVQAILLT